MPGRITKSFVAALAAAMAIAATAGVTLALRPTVADFVEAADVVCATRDAKIASLKMGTSMTAMKTFSASLAKATSETVTALDEIARPSSDDVDDVFDALRAAARAATALNSAAGERDFPATAKAAEELSSTFDRADGASRKLGMSECGRTGAKITGSSATAAPPILKRAYINDANVHCHKAMEKIDAEPEPFDLTELDAYMGFFVTESTALTERLRSITPPPAEAAKADKVFDSFDTLIASAKSLRASVQAQDLEQLDPRFLKFLQDTAAANKAADQYGLVECGSGV